MFTKGNFQNIIKQAKNVQEKLEETHAELEKLVFQGQASGDMVVAKVNGKQELLALKIDPEILQEDVEMLEDLVIAAVNQAMKKASEESQKRFSGLSGNMLNDLGNLDIPGVSE